MAPPDQTPESIAYQRGREAAAREARTDARLVILEDHRKTVNGQLVRLANGQDDINGRLDDVISRLDDAALVSKTLEEAAKHAGARKLGRWQLTGLVLGVPVGVVTIALYLIDAIKGLH